MASANAEQKELKQILGSFDPGLISGFLGRDPSYPIKAHWEFLNAACVGAAKRRDKFLRYLAIHEMFGKHVAARRDVPTLVEQIGLARQRIDQIWSGARPNQTLPSDRSEMVDSLERARKTFPSESKGEIVGLRVKVSSYDSYPRPLPNPWPERVKTLREHFPEMGWR